MERGAKSMWESARHSPLRHGNLRSHLPRTGVRDSDCAWARRAVSVRETRMSTASPCHLVFFGFTLSGSTC